MASDVSSYLAKILTTQPNKNNISFQRNLIGNHELVSYYPDTSIRLWINQENTSYPTHWHTEIELIMPIENTYTVIMKNTKYHLQPNDILIIPSGELHNLIAPSNGIRLVYLIDIAPLNLLKSFTFLNPLLTQPILMNKETFPKIAMEQVNLMLMMCYEYYSDNPLKELSVYSNLIKLFVNYGTSRMDMDLRIPVESQDKRRELTDKMKIVFEYLNQHFTDDITLDQVSDFAGFSKFYFSRLFKQCSGQNFTEYICYKRIKAAEQLLLNSKLSITEIALQSGFSSLSTFNRTFRKNKSCTPSEFRALYNNK